MITELDKQIRAKQYMDKLAQGINPLTDEPLPEDTVLNEVRLARCFFYVSELLRQLIDSGGRPRSAENAKPFRITEEERRRVPVSDEPVTISMLVKAINDAVSDRQMKKLAAAAVTNWLAKEGYLRVVEDERGRHKDVTEKSKDIGITSEQKTGVSGPYISILYDRNAQQYILEHLDGAIL